MNTRAREAAQRFADRRKREDEAPRLSAEVPNLVSLRLTIEERRASARTPESKHVRVVVVDRAPALFIIPCGDPACEDGGYDVTDRVMRELRDRHAEFSVEDECYGHTSAGHCGRILHASGAATYRT